MTKVPVARRRYDITPAEMLDLAKTAVDSVVAELQSRTQELLPDQLARLEQVSASLAKTVAEVADSSYRSQMDAVKAGLDAVRDDVSGAMAEHDARLVQAVENRLAGYDPAELSRRLPPAVASAVLDGLESALPSIDKGLDEVRELVGELVERGKRSEMSRQSSLDRLDEVLLDLRAGLAENLTRQHGVLLEMLDDKLSGLRLNEMAAELPGRIGAVISDAVQKSHDVQAESMHELASGLSQSLDAGLNRQRAATAELSATAERMAESVSGFSQVAEEAVTIAFERAQAAQAQRLNTMMRELREAQEEAAAELRLALEGAVHELRTSQAEQVSSLEVGLDERLAARLDTGLAPHLEAFGQLQNTLSGGVEWLGERFDSAITPQLEATTELRQTVEGAIEGMGERVELALAPQMQAATDLREGFDIAVERLAGRVESAVGPQVEAAVELRASVEEMAERVGERVESALAPQVEASVELRASVEGMAERVGAQIESAISPQIEATAELRKSLRGAVESLSEQIEMAAVPQLQAASELRDAFAVVSRELQASQEDGAAALAADLERRVGDRLEAILAPHQESISEATRNLAELVAGQADGMVAGMDAVSDELAHLRSTTESQRASHEAALSSTGERLDQLADRLESQAESHAAALTKARDELTAHLSELMETVSPRVATELAAVLEESRSRQERVETLIAELAWIVGEQRAGSAGLRDDMAKTLEALPAAIAALQESSLRSEARITDLLARKLQGPDAR